MRFEVQIVENNGFGQHIIAISQVFSDCGEMVKYISALTDDMNRNDFVFIVGENGSAVVRSGNIKRIIWEIKEN